MPRTTHSATRDEALKGRQWWVVDGTDQTVGRLATRLATILKGKHKPSYTPHVDMGDNIIVVNAEKVVFTGNKLDQQEYHKYTGSIGHMRTLTAREMLAKKPEVIIESAVKRMLPRGPLGRRTFDKLKVYAGPQHPHTAQNPKPTKL